MNPNGAVLPYRSEASDLQQLIHALLRGQSRAQARRSHFSTKSFEGVLATAQSLALVDSKTGAVTEPGRRYALATPAQRPAVLRELLAGYPPFAQVLQAAEAGGERSTTLRWIVSWWAAHGYGSSESNRVEAAPAFAKLVAAAGLGSYIQGRKGHPSRIEWNGGVAEQRPAGSDEGVSHDRRASPVEASSSRAGNRVTLEQNLLQWELTPGRCVKLELPAAITAPERARLRRLLEVLLAE